MEGAGAVGAGIVAVGATVGVTGAAVFVGTTGSGVAGAAALVAVASTGTLPAAVAHWCRRQGPATESRAALGIR